MAKRKVNDDPFSKEYLGFYLPWHVYKNPNTPGAFVLVTNKYDKVGSKWVLRSSKYRRISAMEYSNGVSKPTIKFFKSLGGYEKVNMAYSDYGYIAYEVNSINPGRTEKTLRTYYTPKEWKHSGKYIVAKYNSKRD